MFAAAVSFVALLLFTIGLYGVMTSRVGIKMLISIEIMINSAILSIIGIGSYFYSSSVQIDPYVFALFAIAIGVVESAVGLGLLVIVYRKFGKIDISLLKEIRW
ncbi:NADH dehydrogenase I chain H [Thermoplasma volcanium GSS1]|uniref:NADH dehydrogenase I chain H n=1 Tax=Thermoplasma volcanium (strain ATCC 51530 / DSM 4299 / JCM 9571 / NBRC 15438 / GSS1) TaxID=273116 RepID=Q979M8_THEVO|nr:NADH-quinone oxidoreductase subunit NuoK [Thermoplasma volcanium]BAB60274.1 NADH dehydrogenase I chain H [Thermoplasma volcanium GSS1]